ncbi:MAG TPA: hypothetical protein VFV87_19990 [Pirellulaceae bacterium]|nr:hypothetical protein [Pirellulaceae bacterium]
MFRFTIRELILLTLCVALGVEWSFDHSRMARESRAWQSAATILYADLQAATGESPKWEILGAIKGTFYFLASWIRKK